MPPQILALIFNKYTAAIVLVLSVLGYIYFLRHSVEVLQKEKTELLLVVEQQKRAVEQMQKDIANVVKAKDDLVAAKESLDAEKKKLEETLYRETKKKKSLEELAQKKTTLVQKLVNKATQEVFDCFEVISAGGDCK